MKVVLLLMITVSLVLGVVSGVTAYLPRLDLPDAQLVGLTLNAPAGVQKGTQEAPVAVKGAKVTAEVLATLRGEGVERIRVKEFSLGRWDHWWLFVVGCAGLGSAGLVAKRRSRRALAETARDGSGGTSPRAALASIAAEVARLRAALPTMADQRARLRVVIGSLDELQKGSIAAFVAARPLLVTRLGLGGYARLMDAFAAAERQLNRAWSAAADEVEVEAVECLGRAAELLEEARERLGEE